MAFEGERGTPWGRKGFRVLKLRGLMAFEEYTHRLLSGSFLWFIFRILEGNPKKELLRSLRVGIRWGYKGFRAFRVLKLRRVIKFSVGA